jgi:serine/threonine-protein kinase
VRISLAICASQACDSASGAPAWQASPQAGHAPGAVIFLIGRHGTRVPGDTGDVEGTLLAGRYRLTEPLGRGGMGRVWRGWDELLGRPVAVKTMELDRADPAAAERFGREARTTAWLSHPNIVTVFDTGTEGATAFLVMELLSGPDLDDRLAAAGALPIAEVAAVGAQVAAALAAAHAAGVVHRDVKPANIGFAAGGQVKVLDFGIARLLGDARLTRTATVIGTADYLAPEQASGAPAGGYTDLYALGCVLFAMLTGSPPFTGGTPAEVCARHLHAPPPDVAVARPGCPAPLAGLVSELLAKDPAARPGDAAMVRDQLTALADPRTLATALPPLPSRHRPSDTKILASPAPPPGRWRAWPRRRVVAVCSAAAALLAAAVAVALMPAGSSRQQAPGAAASQPGPKLTVTPKRPAAARPGPRPPRRLTASLTPVQAITGFSAAVTRAEAAGGLAQPAAQDLLNRMTDLQATIAAGHAPDAGHKVADLIHHLGGLSRSGQLTAAGLRLISGPLAALERAIPPQAGAGA